MCEYGIKKLTKKILKKEIINGNYIYANDLMKYLEDDLLLAVLENDCFDKIYAKTKLIEKRGYVYNYQNKLKVIDLLLMFIQQNYNLKNLNLSLIGSGIIKNIDQNQIYFDTYFADIAKEEMQETFYEIIKCIIINNLNYIMYFSNINILSFDVNVSRFKNILNDNNLTNKYINLVMKQKYNYLLFENLKEINLNSVTLGIQLEDILNLKIWVTYFFFNDI